MSDPTPLTERELIERQQDDIDELVAENDRLLATVDAERARASQAMWTCPDCAFSFAAEHTDPDGSYTCPCCAEAALTAERDAARADRVCWRETHNQVAAERDAADSVIRHWHKHGFVRSPDMHTWTDIDWADSSWTSAEADAIRRALDASPTEGNPE